MITAESVSNDTDQKSSPTNLTCLQLLEKTKLAEYGDFSFRHESDCWIVVDLKFSTDVNFKHHVVTKLYYRKHDKITLVFQKSCKTHQYPCAAATQIYRGRGIYLTTCNADVTRVAFHDKSPFQHPIILSMGTVFAEWYQFQPKYRLLYVPKATLAMKLSVNGTTLDNLDLKLHAIPTAILPRKSGNYLQAYRGLSMEDDHYGDCEKRHYSNQGVVVMNRTLVSRFFSAKLADYTPFFYSEHLNNITVLHNCPCWFFFIIGPSKDQSKAFVLRKATCLKKCSATFDLKKGFRLKKCYTDNAFGLGYTLWVTGGEEAVFIEPSKKETEKYIKNTDLFTFDYWLSD